MVTIDQVEKGGRFLLWIVLAAAAAVVPIGAYDISKASARTAEQVRLDAARDAAKEKAAKEAANKPARLSLASLGPILNLLEGSIGTIWFSNATSHEGFVCVQGIVSVGEQSTKSLASCRKLDAYETNVKMTVEFAGASIKAICPTGSCSFNVKDIPVETEPTPVATK